jgi:hypothetical protein
MTTTISFAARDCIVLGCDSLATTTSPVVSLHSLVQFFDFDNDFCLRNDEGGKPVLKNLADLQFDDLPFNQIPNVTKIFSLAPAHAGLLFAGIAAINNKSIKNLIDEFLGIAEIRSYLRREYTVLGIANRLRDHIRKDYEAEFGNSAHKPGLEILISGYSKKHLQPEVVRIVFGKKEKLEREVERGDYDIVTAGQNDVIERVIRGLDFSTYRNHIRYLRGVLTRYRTIIAEALESQKIKAELPDFDESLKDEIIDYSWACGIASDLTNFSDQAAIDFVDFLVDVMIKAQQFSNELPTVGGEIHIAVITKTLGFKWISKEEYRYHGYGVPKHA